MSNVAIIILVLLAAAAGFVGGGYAGLHYERGIAAERIAAAEKMAAEQLSTERRLLAQQEQRTEAVTKVTQAAAQISNCPLPADVAGLLNAQVEATSVPGIAVPGGKLSRPTAEGVSGR